MLTNASEVEQFDCPHLMLTNASATKHHKLQIQRGREGGGGMGVGGKRDFMHTHVCDTVYASFGGHASRA